MENAIWHGKPCLENGDQFAATAVIFIVLLSSWSSCFLSYVEFDASLKTLMIVLQYLWKGAYWD